VYVFFGNETFLEYCYLHLSLIQYFQEHESLYPPCRREILEALTNLVKLNIDDFVYKFPEEYFPLIFNQICQKGIEELDNPSNQ
jgi:hypothetical protein